MGSLCTVAKYEISRHVSIEVPKIKFRGNPPSGSRADTCGTDTTKLIDAFRDYAKASKSEKKRR
jgi:hypothetical protein